MRPDEAKAACDACMAWHHAECWSEHGACSACGAARGVGEASAPAPRHAGASPCAARGCLRPRQDEVVSAEEVPLSAGGSFRLADLCAAHAVEGLEGRLALSQRLDLAFVALALVGFGAAVLSGVQPAAALLLGGLPLLLALTVFVHRYGLRLKLRRARRASAGADEEQLGGEAGAHGKQ